jgi:PAS domain-containing protein
MSSTLDAGAFLKPADAMGFVQTILQALTEYPIIGHGLDGTILLWNSGAERQYGYRGRGARRQGQGRRPPCP